MKLSTLHPCDSCGGPLSPPSTFYVVRLSLAIISPVAYQQTIGLTQIFGGALGLAEAMSPDPDVIKIAGDEDKNLMTELLICQNCFMTKDFNIAQLSEGRHRGGG